MQLFSFSLPILIPRVKNKEGFIIKKNDKKKGGVKDERRSTFRSTNASANIEYRPEFSHLVGLLGDLSTQRNYNNKTLLNGVQ